MTCPNCQGETRCAMVDGTPQEVCLSCLQVVKPGHSTVSEERVQEAVIRALRDAGYKVKSTVHRFHKGDRPRGYGASPGIPDLYVRRECWPRGMALGLEVKRPGRWRYSSDGQRTAGEEGWFYVVQNADQACAVAAQFERDLGDFRDFRK